jgi:hypothetical protein
MLCPMLSSADDSAVSNIGGTVHLMDEHPSIRLVAEHVHAWVSKSSIEVECVFFLTNEGPSTTVDMGFPDLSWTGGRSAPFPFFESFVNGKKVEITPTESKDGRGGVLYWWTKKVSFDSGETKVIRDRYKARPGVNSTGAGWFDYILYTGASWAGRIGSASIVVTLVDIEARSLVKVQPSDFEMTGNEITWNFSDFEPVEGSPWNGMIHVKWIRPRWERYEVKRAAAIVTGTLVFGDWWKKNNRHMRWATLEVHDVLKGRPDLQRIDLLISVKGFSDGQEGVWMLNKYLSGEEYYVMKFIPLAERADFEDRFRDLFEKVGKNE